MYAGVPGREDSGYCLRQFTRRLDRRSLPTAHDRASNLTRPSFFAVLPQNVGDVFLWKRVHDIPSSDLEIIVQSHVQWLVMAERKPPALSLIHISEPTRLGMISYAVFCLKKKKKKKRKHHT